MQVLCRCIQTIRLAGPYVHVSLSAQLRSLLPGLLECCKHRHAGVQEIAASAVEALASAKPGIILPPMLRYYLLEALIPAASTALADLGRLQLVLCYETPCTTVENMASALATGTTGALCLLCKHDIRARM